MTAEAVTQNGSLITVALDAARDALTDGDGKVSQALQLLTTPTAATEPLTPLAREGLDFPQMVEGGREGKVNGEYVFTVPLPDQSGDLFLKGDVAGAVSIFLDLPQKGFVPTSVFSGISDADLDGAKQALYLVGASYISDPKDDGYRLVPLREPDTLPDNTLRVPTVDAAVSASHEGPIVIVQQDQLTRNLGRAIGNTGGVRDFGKTMGVLSRHPHNGSNGSSSRARQKQ